MGATDPSLTYDESEGRPSTNAQITSLAARVTALETEDGILHDEIDSIVSAGIPVISSRAGLQSYLDGDASIARKVELTALASINCDQQVNIINGAGGVLEGQCSGFTVDDASFIKRLQSGLYYSGSRLGTESLLYYERMDFVMRNLNLWGATAAQMEAGAMGRCPYGLYVKRAAIPGLYEGVGTGKIKAENLSFDYFDVAINLGGILGDHNCDESIWDGLLFDRCGDAFRIINTQGLGHTVKAPRFSRVTNCFNFFGGGDFDISGTTLITQLCTFIKFNSDTPNGLGVASSIDLSGRLKIDDQARYSTILDMEVADGYYNTILLKSVCFPQLGWTDPVLNPYGIAFTVGSQATLDLINPQVLQPGMIAWNCDPGRMATVRIFGGTAWNVLTNSAIASPADLFNVARSRGQCRVLVYGLQQLGGLRPIMAEYTNNGNPLTGAL